MLTHFEQWFEVQEDDYSPLCYANADAEEDEEDEDFADVLGEGEEVEEEVALPVFRVGDSLGSLDSFRPGPASSASSASLDSLRPAPRRPVDDEKEPEFDDDNRQSDEYAQGVFVEDAARGKREAAPRSNMESAQMEETEVAQVAPVFESAAEPAVRKVVRRRYPNIAPPAQPLTDAERETLEKNQRELADRFKYRAALVKAVEDGTIESSDFDTSDSLDEVARFLREKGLHDRNASGSALRGYVKQQFKKKVELIEETKRLLQKDKFYQVRLSVEQQTQKKTP
jgi:hypothetical protein